MNLLSRAGAWLAAASIVVPASTGRAWPLLSWPPLSSSIPLLTQTPAMSGSSQQNERRPRESRRRGRTARTPRTSEPRRSTNVVVESPDEDRVSRDPGPVRQELTLEVNVLGGYDDDVTARFEPGAGSPWMASGSVGYLDGRLDYRRGDRSRWIAMQSQGSLLAYPDYLARPAAGGEAGVAARTTLGRSLGLGASGELRYEPFFRAFSPGAGAEPLLPGVGDAAPATLYEHRSLRSYATVYADHLSTRGGFTRLALSRGRRQFDAERGDNDWLEVRAEHGMRIRHAIGRAEYRYVNTAYVGVGSVERFLSEHTLSGGADLEIRPSRRRLLVVALRAGAGYIESSDRLTSGGGSRSWVPVGRGSAAFSLSPSWVLEGGFQRTFQLLQGLTDEVYTADSGFLGASGTLSRRIDLRAGATHGSWRTSLTQGTDDRMRVSGASLQLNVRISGAMAGTLAYSYYHHTYSNPGTLPPGFPPVYDRHAVRAGLTISIPLVAPSSSSPQTPNRSQ